MDLGKILHVACVICLWIQINFQRHIHGWWIFKKYIQDELLKNVLVILTIYLQEHFMLKVLYITILLRMRDAGIINTQILTQCSNVNVK